MQGVNLRWRHMRKSQKHPQGGRVRREMSIHISNVMVFDETVGSRTRLGVAVNASARLFSGSASAVGSSGSKTTSNRLIGVSPSTAWAS